MTYIIVILLIIIACSVASKVMETIGAAILVCLATAGAVFVAFFIYLKLGDENVSAILYGIALLSAMIGIVTFGFLFDKTISKKPLLITIVTSILVTTGAGVHVSKLADKKVAVESRRNKECEKYTMPIAECVQNLKEGKVIPPWFHNWKKS